MVALVQSSHRRPSHKVCCLQAHPWYPEGVEYKRVSELRMEDQDKVLIGLVQGYSLITMLGAITSASRRNRQLWKSVEVAQMVATVQHYYREHRLEGDVAAQGEGEEGECLL